MDSVSALASSAWFATVAVCLTSLLGWLAFLGFAVWVIAKRPEEASDLIAVVGAFSPVRGFRRERHDPSSVGAKRAGRESMGKLLALKEATVSERESPPA